MFDEDALIEAVESGKVKKYVTDFANETVAGREGILVTPHLGRVYRGIRRKLCRDGCKGDSRLP